MPPDLDLLGKPGRRDRTPVNLLQRLRARDPGLSVPRRALRVAILMPALFALAEKGIGNSTLAIFAAFGSLVMMMFVDFSGPMRERVAAQICLVLASSVLICLGTLAGQAVWIAAVATLVVALAVLFVGVVSSVLAGATTSLLISFVLPVTLPGPVSSIPDRLGGWLLAGVVSVVAGIVLWPAPTREPLRTSTAQACALLARRLRVDCARDGSEPGRTEALDAAIEQAVAGVVALRESFFATPYRPTGLSTAARTLVRLIDQVIWLDTVLGRMPLKAQAGPSGAAVRKVESAAATLLERGAELLGSAADDPYRLAPDARRLRLAREALERTATSALPVRTAQASARGAPSSARDVANGAAAEFVSSLEPCFRAQEMSYAISAIAMNIELTVAARQRGWWQQLLGRRPEGVVSTLSSAQVTDEGGQGTPTAVRMIWTADHLDAVRRLQAGIVGPARAAAAAQRSPRSWLGAHLAQP